MTHRFSWIAALTGAVLATLAFLSACEFVDSTKDGGDDSGYYYETGGGSDTGEYYY